MNVLPRRFVAAGHGVLLLFAFVAVAHAAPGDENWSLDYFRNGADDPVNAALEFGGDLVIGGEFTRVGGQDAVGVARFDGTQWNPMGDGLDGRVTDLHVHAGALYAIGDFQNSGATPITGLARWDGSTWIEVGGGVEFGTCMETFEGDLIVGGSFDTVGSPGVAADGVARFDGTTWSSMNTGFFDIEFGQINALAVFNGELYAGGFFLGASGAGTKRGGFGAPGHVARFDQTEWNVLDGGLLGFGDPYSAEVADLEVFDGNLWVAGFFDQTGDGLPADGIARWNGFAWDGPTFLFDTSSANALTVHDGSLFIADFNLVARRETNGSQTFLFFTAGQGGSGGSFIDDMTSYGTDLVIHGDFGFVDESGTNHVALYDGVAPRSVDGGRGVEERIQRAIEWNGDLVIAGNFISAGGAAETHGLARLGANGWESIGGGITSSNFHAVRSIAVHQGDLIAGGSFTEIGGVTANRVARWDGTAWTPMGSGSVSSVTALYDWNGTLYAHMDPTPGSGSITRWTGTTWEIVGQDTFGGDVEHLTEFGGQLIAAGQMNSIAGVAVDHIAAFDGTTWTSFAGGVSGGQFTRIFGMLAQNGSLYLSGDFTQAGPTPVGYVARWDGTSWDDLDGGFDATGRGLGWYDGQLVATGFFNTVGSTSLPAVGLARYDGSSWSTFGSGVDAGAYVAFAFGDDPLRRWFVRERRRRAVLRRGAVEGNDLDVGRDFGPRRLRADGRAESLQRADFDLLPTRPHGARHRGDPRRARSTHRADAPRRARRGNAPVPVGRPRSPRPAGGHGNVLRTHPGGRALDDHARVDHSLEREAGSADRRSPLPNSHPPVALSGGRSAWRRRGTRPCRTHRSRAACGVRARASMHPRESGRCRSHPRQPRRRARPPTRRRHRSTRPRNGSDGPRRRRAR